ncbi:MAG: outer membrane protein assembly factor [Chromatiales bacterium]|nr:outer membrane protein assembly factor [Chromatiales bacterium]
MGLAQSGAALAVILALMITPARADVKFEGLSRTTEKVVRATVALVDEPCAAPDARVRRLYRRADQQILQALEVYGYYAPTIDKSLERDQDCWRARFTINRGPRVKLRDVRIGVTGAGQSDSALAGLLAKRDGLAPGEGLNQRAYDAYKATLASTAQRRGFFDGRFAASRIDVYPAELAADVTIEYVSGERYRFGAVTLDQDVVNPELALSYVDFRPGEPYDAERVNELYIDLLAGGYFQNVELRTTPRPAPDLDVPVTIVLTAAPPRTWKTGIGYATDTGAKFRLDYLNERLNRKGHKLEFNSSLSQVLGGATLSYRLPRGSPRDEWLSFETGYKYDDPADSRSDEFRLGVKDVKRRRGNWRETRSLDYVRETFQVGSEDKGTSDLVLPGISWSDQPRLLPPRPRKAHRLSFSVSGTDEILGSDTAFLQLESAGKLILPLWTTARLLVRGDVGWTIKDEFKDLPFSVRYFAGGDGSVRGYDYKTLGPTDDTGSVTGGADTLVGSVEFDQKVVGNWSVAAFVDMGNAFDSFKSMSLKTGVGAGIRWFSPLGPIRFDVGVPLDDAPDSFRIHITLGPDL